LKNAYHLLSKTLTGLLYYKGCDQQYKVQLTANY